MRAGQPTVVDPQRVDHAVGAGGKPRVVAALKVLAREHELALDRPLVLVVPIDERVARREKSSTRFRFPGSVGAGASLTLGNRIAPAAWGWPARIPATHVSRRAVPAALDAPAPGGRAQPTPILSAVPLPRLQKTGGSMTRRLAHTLVASAMFAALG